MPRTVIYLTWSTVVRRYYRFIQMIELGHKSLVTGPVLYHLTCSCSITVIQPNNTFRLFQSWCQLPHDLRSNKVYRSDFNHPKIVIL